MSQKIYLQEVVRRRDKSGNLTFPRLRHCLVTRCGTYAWQRGKFDLDQNLTVAPFTFKGRAVTEFNIQVRSIIRGRYRSKVNFY
ncbi:hypothetical protein NQ314_017394 [Rhamnusium bicolor]|uniref:Uncharacterized protein n=1 Tax=Rhamnusium bicolor TaxID=1586634 RepID=A0AAV8WUA6_9CUCU|nr:hypothetical protein NQ314_017394 [Rhamnusium bicolor]